MSTKNNNQPKQPKQTPPPRPTPNQGQTVSKGTKK